MVDLIFKISGDAAEKKNHRPALILSLNTTTVTPDSKFDIQLHSPRDTDCELPIPSELHSAEHIVILSTNVSLDSCQLCVPYFPT